MAALVSIPLTRESSPCTKDSIDVQIARPNAKFFLHYLAKKQSRVRYPRLVNNRQPVSVQVYVEVLDKNDNTPLTEVPVYYPSVLENSPAGVSVLQIRAFDRDVSPQRFTFSITSGNPEGYFLINSTTGKFHMVTLRRERERKRANISEPWNRNRLATRSPIVTRSIWPPSMNKVFNGDDSKISFRVRVRASLNSN